MERDFLRRRLPDLLPADLEFYLCVIRRFVCGLFRNCRIFSDFPFTSGFNALKTDQSNHSSGEYMNA